MPHSVYWGLGNTPFDREIAYRALFEADSDVPDETLARTLTAGRPLADLGFLERIERLVRGHSAADDPSRRPERTPRSDALTPGGRVGRPGPVACRRYRGGR